MQIAPFALRLAEASSTAHLDKIERGYENMDHYTVDFKRQAKALRCLDFLQGKGTELVMAAISLLTAPTCSNLTFTSPTDDEDEDEEDEDGEAATEEGEGAQTVSGGGAVPAASVQPPAPQPSSPSTPSAAKSVAST